MRIKSNFRDYYDSAMKHGQDASILYLRYKKEEDLGAWPFKVDGKSGVYASYGNWQPRKVRDVDASVLVVGFCGKVYRCLDIGIEPADDDAFKANPDIYKRHFCYSIEDLDHVMKATFSSFYEEYEHADKNDRYHTARDMVWPRTLSRHCQQRCFDDFAKCQCRWAHIFDEARCPIFIARSIIKDRKRPWYTFKNSNTITWNDELRRVEFFRVFDPYQAYQEVSMWLGNLAEPRKPVPPISDEVMAEIKGFDKYSFRKDKKQR